MNKRYKLLLLLLTWMLPTMLFCQGNLKGARLAGQLSGVFSVSENTQVSFSQGNLQYQSSTNTWRFAENQWDYIGEDNANGSSDYAGWIDLFGWGTSGYNHGANCYQPWTTDGNSNNYYAYGNSTGNLYDQSGQADWGYNAISNGGNQENIGWRSLTKEEWTYLFDTRSTGSGIRYAKAIVNNVNGVILLPDDWDVSYFALNSSNTNNASFSSNSITIAQWSALAQRGAVFFPAAGHRYGTTIRSVGTGGYIWSSSYSSSNYTNNVFFSDLNLNASSSTRPYYGFSVRLVCEAQVVSDTYWTPQSEGFEDNMTLTGVIQIDGVEQMTTALELGAFCNGECRGTVRPVYFPATQRYLAMITIYGENGDALTFKLYDHEQNVELDLVSPQGIVFGSSSIGSLMDPCVLNFTHPVVEYSIGVTPNPAAGGTVNGTGTYQEGAECTLTATASAGYTFTNWTENGTVVSTSVSYTFTVTGDRDLVANFQKNQSTRHWVLSGHSSNWDEMNMTTSMVVFVDGVELSDPNIEMAAFNGNTLMSNGTMPWIVNGHSIYYMTINGFETPSNSNFYNRMSFRLYDHSTETELDYVAPFEIIYSSNWYLGSSSYPFGVPFFSNEDELEWRKVDGSELQNGDVIVIGGAESDYIISREEGIVGGSFEMNRLGNVITFSEPASALAWNNKAPQKFTVYQNAVATANNKVALLAHSGFLRPSEVNPGDGIDHNAFDLCSSLVTSNNPTEWNAYWSVTSEDGVHHLVSGGSNPYSIIQFDPTENQFACYSSASEEGLCIYRLGVRPISYGITAVANPNYGGTVSGGDTYQENTTCTVIAAPNEGWAFTNWTENDAVVSTEETYSFTVTGLRTLVANFEMEATENYYTPQGEGFEDNMTLTGVIQIEGVEQTTTALELGAFCNGQCRGTVRPIFFPATQRYLALITIFGENGDALTFKLYDHEQDAELDLVSPQGIVFGSSSIGSLMDPCVLNFTHPVVEYSIGVTANPAAGGTVSGAGTYQEGQSCTLTATPNAGYTFVRWTKNGSQVSTNPSYTFTVTADASYVAEFSLNSYGITVTASPAEGGTVTGVGNYSYGSSVTLTATPNAGYTFVRWTKNGTQVSTNPSYTFTVSGAASYVAVFSLNSYAITASANPSDGGTVSGAGTYNHGASCSLNATANEGYAFVNWTENGTAVSTANPYSFTVTGARILVAQFEVVQSDEDHWIPQSEGYEDNMTLTGVIQIDGVEQMTTSLELGAFCNGECRGTVRPVFFPMTQRYLAMITIFGVNGDELTFKLYDHDQNEELDLVSPEGVVFGTNSYGSIMSPYVLNFTSSVFSYYWTPVHYASDAPMTMTMIGMVRIDFEEQAVNNLEVGAFSNDVCRGRSMLEYDEGMDRYLVFLTLWGNNGNALTFRLYDHTTGTELDLICATELTYTDNAHHGSLTEPYPIDFVTDVSVPTTFTRTLDAGWNWFSCNIEFDADKLEDLKSAIAAVCSSAMIKSQNNGFINYASGRWSGSITQLGNEMMLLICVDQEVDLQMEGMTANPLLHSVTLTPGWNWIGYVEQGMLSLSAAFANFTPENGDMVKCMNSFSIYNATLGTWSGNLKNLEPGNGYVYLSNRSGSIEFMYPTSGKGE